MKEKLIKYWERKERQMEQSPEGKTAFSIRLLERWISPWKPLTTGTRNLS